MPADSIALESAGSGNVVQNGMRDSAPLNHARSGFFIPSYHGELSGWQRRDSSGYCAARLARETTSFRHGPATSFFPKAAGGDDKAGIREVRRN
jgi:hypothetical protein